MRSFNEQTDPNRNQLDHLDIHSAVVRRGSLPGHSRPQSVKYIPRQQGNAPSSDKHIPRQQGSSPSSAKPIYEETYYISSLRDNYLTLISDNLEVLELPLGLIQDTIKIGCPIRLRLEYDHRRQQTDDHRFKTIQK